MDHINLKRKFKIVKSASISGLEEKVNQLLENKNWRIEGGTKNSEGYFFQTMIYSHIQKKIGETD